MKTRKLHPDHKVITPEMALLWLARHLKSEGKAVHKVGRDIIVEEMK